MAARCQHRVDGTTADASNPLRCSVVCRCRRVLRGSEVEVVADQRDRVLTAAQLELEDDMIAVALAGRAAEEVVYGEVTTGAQNDFQQATNIARRMVTEWGMSPAIGKVALASEDGAYLGGGTQQVMTSEATARVIDEQVREIVDAAYERVMRLMRQHLDDMHQIVTVLMQRETLSGEEFSTLLGGGHLAPVSA